VAFTLSLEVLKMLKLVRFSPAGWVITLCLAAVAPVVSAGAAEKPTTGVRAEIPDRYKWDLSEIYPDWETWERDYAVAEAARDKLVQLRGSLSGGAESLLVVMRTFDEYGIIADRVALYADLMQVTDMGNSELGARSQRAENLKASFNEASSWFEPELLALPWDTVEHWLAITPDLAPYRFRLENLNRRRAHILSSEEEALLSCFSAFSATPVSIYDDFSIADIKFPDWVTAKGDTVKLTFGEYLYNLRTNRSQEERRAMAQLLIRTYADYVNTYASIYNGVLQNDWAQARARHYGSALEAALDEDHVPVSVYMNLISSVRGEIEVLQRYHRLRKKALGLEHYYSSDRLLPISDAPPTIEYDSLGPMVVEAVAPLGEKYQEQVRKLLGGRYVDVYANDGKYSGGFENDVYNTFPRILMNYDGTLSEAFTLPHEVGHAMHSEYSDAAQPYATAYYTIFVAEVPSTLNEALFLESLLKHAKSPAERVAILETAINNLETTFFRQVFFADFELQAHNLVEQGEPVTAESLGKVYGDLTKVYYGDAVETDSTHNCYWAAISHFFESPYYVYKYATSYATSAQLVQGIKASDENTRQETLDRFMTLIKSGGNDYPMEQLKKAGVDLNKPDAVNAVIRQMDDLVTQLEKELAHL